MLAKHLLNSGAAKTYIEDVFGINLRTGTGASATITGMPDLATYGGMVHTKSRDITFAHAIVDSSRGVSKYLKSNVTDDELTDSTGITAFLSNGYSLGSSANSVHNASGYQYVDWVYRNAPNFFRELHVTKSAGSNRVIDLSPYFPSSSVGMVKVKRTDAAGSWYIWHRSLTAGKLLIGETTAAETTLGHITVSGKTLTLVDGVIADGDYHIEVYAHDTTADGLIQCGSVTTDGSGNMSPVTIGWEPGWVLWKKSSAASAWNIQDNMRGFTVNDSGNNNTLSPNTSSAESSGVTAIQPTATGFKHVNGMLDASSTYIYVAIRRGPMKPPTSGTQVYNAIARTGTGAAATVTGVGFPIDFSIIQSRAGASPRWGDRLRGPASVLRSNLANAELTAESDLSSFDMDGISLTGVGASLSNATATAYINYFFRRYPGVFDQTCWEGNSTDPRTIELPLLGVPAEMIVAKARSANDWVVWHSAFGNSSAVNNLYLNSTSAIKVNGGLVGTTVPTANGFKVADGALVNATGNNYAGWAFATLAGVSKVFAETKVSGINKYVDCQFAAGSRFVLLKRTDAAGDWYLWDSVRGIVAGNDPYLLLNSSAAEVTTTDYIDPYAAGFTIVDGGLPNGDYIGVAIS